MTVKKVAHFYLIPGTLVRPENDWCDTCQVPSKWHGPIWCLGPAGVGDWGWITGCFQCDTWDRQPHTPKP